MQKTPEMRTCKNRALTALVSVFLIYKYIYIYISIYIYAHAYIYIYICVYCGTHLIRNHFSMRCNDSLFSCRKGWCRSDMFFSDKQSLRFEYNFLSSFSKKHKYYSFQDSPKKKKLVNLRSFQGQVKHVLITG